MRSYIYEERKEICMRKNLTEVLLIKKIREKENGIIIKRKDRFLIANFS